MQWRDPWSFLGLAAVAALAAFLVWAWRRRQQALAAFVAAPLQPVVVPDVDPRRRRLRAALVVSAAGLLVVALAGPMWGFRWEQVQRRGIDLVIALDTSRSMLATDVKSNRLARAELAVRDLVAEARGDRLALVPFAGTAFLQCPLTLDTGAFLQSLDAVEVGIIPRGGTALAAAIETSLAAFEGREANHQAIVLITDGESHEGDLDAAVAQARERGVRIFTVGIGTTEGELLPDEGGTFVKDRRGQVVKSRLDRATLERIAVETGGVYLQAGTAGPGLTELYRDHIATMDERELESTLERRFEQRYQWPLGLAFLLLVLERLLHDRRARPAMPGVERRPRNRSAAAAAVLLASVSIGWLDPHAAAREGNRLYDGGRYDEAAERYRAGLVDDPESPRLHLSLGAARYKAGKYDDALAELEKAPDDETDAARTARRAYNVGNTKFRQGGALEEQQPQQALALWKEAVAAYRRALGADPADVDAKFNHELVEKKVAALERRLEQQQQEQQQQQQQQQQQEGQEQDGEKQGEPRDEQGGQDGGRREQQQRDGQDDSRDARPGDDGNDQKRPGQATRDGGERQPSDDAEVGGAEPERDAGERQPTGGATPGTEAASGDGSDDTTASGGPNRPGALDPDEAAALLDAQRSQEMSPAEVTRRLQPSRVAEPEEDW